MSWSVDFYSVKLRDAILEWPKNLQIKFAHIIGLIMDNGPEEVGLPHIKAMGKGLYEIRAKSDEGIGRAMFCMLKGKNIIILSEFIKKTQKTPSREIELARKRMKEVKNDD